MKIQKVITLMGDRIYLSFFVGQDHTFNEERVTVWCEDIQDKHINIEDNYTYLIDPDNKNEIKKALKEHFKGICDDKSIYKELKKLLNTMKEYEAT